MHTPYYTRAERTKKAYTVAQAVQFAQIYLYANGWECRRLPYLPPSQTAITLQTLNKLQAVVIEANWGKQL